MFFGANSSRPTGSFRQRQRTKGDDCDGFTARECRKILTDVDHCFTMREPCVASLRTDRHQIGITDRHHRNTHADNGGPITVMSGTSNLIVCYAKDTAEITPVGYGPKQYGICVNEMKVQLSSPRSTANESIYFGPGIVTLVMSGTGPLCPVLKPCIRP